MKKNNILIILIIILIIALIFVTLMYINAIRISKANLDNLLKANEDMFEATKTIEDLEEKIKDLEKLNNKNTTNTLNTNTEVSSKPYVPEGMEISEPDYSSEIKSNEIKMDRSPENVKIEVITNTITREKANILIIDNNKNEYSWGASFRLQKKINSNWEEMTPINDLNFISLGYNLNENNELIMEIDYEKYYGSLENGIYRIVKTVYDNKYIDLYSNEFEIK